MKGLAIGSAAVMLTLAACALLLSPLFSTHVTLLRRELRFSTVAKVEALRSFVSGGMEKLPELLGRSDVVVVAAPLTEETAGLIGAPQLREMREGEHQGAHERPAEDHLSRA